MEIIKRSLFVLIMLLVVVLIWVGLSVYFKSSEITINPNVEEHTSQLGESFDLEELEKVSERTTNHFPVTPSVFLSLIERN